MTAADEKDEGLIGAFKALAVLGQTLAHESQEAADSAQAYAGGFKELAKNLPLATPVRNDKA